MNKDKPVNSNIIAAFVGIDWADQKHDIEVRSPDCKPERLIVDNKPDSLHEWVASLISRFAGKGRICVGIEKTRGSILYTLMQYRELTLYPLHCRSLSSFRDTLRASGAKSDRADASLMAELLEKHHHCLQSWSPNDVETRKLSNLCVARRKAVGLRNQLSTSLKHQLKSIFPLALELLNGDLDTKMAIAFLSKWPSLNKLLKSKVTTVRQFFQSNRCQRMKHIDPLLLKLRETRNFTDDPAILEPAELAIEMLAKQLATLIPCIARYDAEIEKTFRAHPDAFIFESLPGAGPALAPRLLTAFGSDRSRFSDAQDVASFSGIAPVKQSSGKMVHIKMRKACSKFVRQTFHEFAGWSHLHCEWARHFYGQQKQSGKKHNVIMRSLAFKWIRIMFACWKSRKAYDDAVYTQSLLSRRAIGPAKSCGE